ncbi:MAG: AhpC/TSA family protein [Actinomycetota bacterium]|nr:AhpC/TSA family protein [Actinomycetota bacterium]
MRDRYDEIKATGADVTAIGMGWPEAAAHFKKERSIPFTLLVDQKRETHKAMEIKRGSLGALVGPKTLLKGAGNLLSGNVQGRPAKGQDITQLGGVVVVMGGRVKMVHRSRSSDDNAPIEEILEALR